MIRMSNFDPDKPGASEAFNDFAKVLDDIAAAMLAGLEVDASILASTMSSYFTSLTAGLREIMPELPALHDINLPAQLTNLSQLPIGSDQYNTLFASIESNFKSALEDAGYSLPELVTKTRTAIDAGETLSGVVPNFVRDAAGLSDAFEEAWAVLHPTADVEAEIISSFAPVLTDLQSNLKSLAADAAAAIEKVEETLTNGDEIITKRLLHGGTITTTTEV